MQFLNLELKFDILKLEIFRFDISLIYKKMLTTF